MADDMKVGAPAATSAPIIKKKRPQVNEEAVQMPWVEKYRPSKLEDLVGHEDITSIIQRLIDNDNLPHLLLYGPPGTGKVCFGIMCNIIVHLWYIVSICYSLYRCSSHQHISYNHNL